MEDAHREAAQDDLHFVILRHCRASALGDHLSVLNVDAGGGNSSALEAKLVEPLIGSSFCRIRLIRGMGGEGLALKGEGLAGLGVRPRHEILKRAFLYPEVHALTIDLEHWVTVHDGRGLGAAHRAS